MKHILDTRIMEMVQKNTVLKTEKEHLETCENCRKLYEEEQQFFSQISLVFVNKKSPDFTNAVLTKLSLNATKPFNFNLFFSIFSLALILSFTVFLFTFIDFQKVMNNSNFAVVLPFFIKYKFFIIGIVGCLIMLSMEKFYYYIKEITYN
jgi:hypothetical protein